MAQSPRFLQDLVGQVFRENRRTDHVTLVTLQSRWAELVGTGLAERTWPIRLQQGVLWIAAPDSSWAYQLQFLKQDFLGGIRAGLPTLMVNELRFKVGPLPQQGPPATGAMQQGDREATPPPARSAEELPSHTAPTAAPAPASVHSTPEQDRTAAAIEDPTLREAFRRTMAKQARRHKASR